jgi:sarcosine oxidase, subunit gamma
MNAHVKSFDQVAVAVLPPVARLNLRLRPADLAAASNAFGLELPVKITQGATKKGRAAYCLGPGS